MSPGVQIIHFGGNEVFEECLLVSLVCLPASLLLGTGVRVGEFFREIYLKRRLLVSIRRRDSGVVECAKIVLLGWWAREGPIERRDCQSRGLVADTTKFLLASIIISRCRQLLY